MLAMCGELGFPRPPTIRSNAASSDVTLPLDEVPAARELKSATRRRGSTHCATRPRARASTTPSARSASSVAPCTASRAAGRIVVMRRRQRPDQPFHQRADDGGRGDAGILLGQMAAVDRGPDARLQFGGERLAEIEPHGVDVGIDRLGDHRPGQPPLVERAARRRSRYRPRAPTAARARRRRPPSWRRVRGRRWRRPVRRRDRSWTGSSDRPCRRRCRRARRPAAICTAPCRPRRRCARRGVEDRLLALGQAADDILGAAIGHGMSE